MRNHKIKIIKEISNKLMCVKTLKELSEGDYDLKTSKFALDKMYTNIGKWVVADEPIPKSFHKHRKLFKDDFGIVFGNSIQDNLTAVLGGKIIMDDTFDKYDSFIASIDPKDEMAIKLFKDLIPFLQYHPFDLKDGLVNLKEDIESYKKFASNKIE